MHPSTLRMRLSFFDVVTVSHDPAWVRQVDDPRERLYADPDILHTVVHPDEFEDGD